MSSKLKTEITVPVYKIPEDFAAFADQSMPYTEEEVLGTFCHNWKITNWSSLEERVHGPVFETEDLKWSLLLYPKGNNHNDVVSAYLTLNTLNETEKDLHVCAQFLMLISSPEDPTVFVHHAAQHRFQKYDSNWGFPNLISHKDLAESVDNKLPFLVDDTVVFTVIVRLIKDLNGVLWHNFIDYDSKKTTGYVGLYNQGATCYMNSLFQSLYFTNYFRLAVYQIPTDSEDESISLAIQRLFLGLQFSEDPVSTTEVTKSFGWNSTESFMQRDIQEFNRLLQDTLEKKMKNTPAEGSIQRLFIGKMRSYIQCIHVNYESSRTENFYDIQLNVKSCKNLQQSFEKYTEIEMLDGDNKYMAEGHGLQDARKGVIFESLPPVLHLQLKRFEYDTLRDTMSKVNDRHEFPSTIDLSPYLSKDTDRAVSYVYTLHGVMVHTGDSNGGHYFSFIRPTTEDKWFKFDDDRVTPATSKEVFEENFGGERLNTHPKLRNRKKSTNAYMLVYIRESSQNEVLQEVTKKDVPEHLVSKFEKEKREIDLIKKRKAEQHLYMKVYIANEESFLKNTGADFIQPSEDEREGDSVVEIKNLKKDTILRDFTNEMSKKLEKNKEHFRLWVVSVTEKNSLRLTRLLNKDDLDLTLEELQQTCHKDYPHLRLYIEDSNDTQTVLPDMNSGVRLLFVKKFDQTTQSIGGTGRIYVDCKQSIGSIENTLNDMCGFEPETALNIYVEFSSKNTVVVDKKSTFQDYKILDGDIICVERQLTTKEADFLNKSYIPTNTEHYLRFIQNQVLITVISKENPMAFFDISLCIDMLYPEIVYRIGDMVQCRPDHLRLLTPDMYGKPKSFVVPLSNLSLEDILQTMPSVEGKRILFYESLPISLEQLETNSIVKVNICYPTTSQVNPFEFIVRKNARLSYISELLQKKLGMENRKVRFFTVEDHKIKSELKECRIPPSELTIHAEFVSDKELQKGDEDFYINVYHYKNSLKKTHSIPFRFLVIKDEPFEESKKRLKEKTGIDDKEWDKVKFSIVSRHILPIKNDFKLSEHKFTELESLGLDHTDINQPKSFENELFIKE
ncbi:hypothetical protein BY458DRAFT_523498 [Sporodiniella umbellata]|nr:hypothetical protein BY458DRAFT_523498 [Sporodiniella umbellata]